MEEASWAAEAVQMVVAACRQVQCVSGMKEIVRFDKHSKTEYKRCRQQHADRWSYYTYGGGGGGSIAVNGSGGGLQKF